MHRRFIAVAVAAVVAVLGFGMATAAAAPPPPPSNFYLALGDSLAAGYQPGAGDNPNGGYVGRVLTRERTVVGPTTLANQACSGETTDTMINGGICTYGAADNQLDAAVAFLNSHSGHVGLITIDIGANDVDKCISASGQIDFPCLQQGINKLNQNLPIIYGALRDAAPSAEIVVANYYDPFLAIWLQGTPQARDTARSSVDLAGSINNIIASKAAEQAMKVADVFTAFQTKNWHRIDTPYGNIPVNVYKICAWTHMCTNNPPDIHANDTGYTVIGRTVSAVVTGAGPGT